MYIYIYTHTHECMHTHIQDDINGWTALHYAAFHGHVRPCQQLVRARANVNITDTKRLDTPLHAALISGREEIAQVLLDAGADKNAINNRCECVYVCVCVFFSQYLVGAMPWCNVLMHRIGATHCCDVLMQHIVASPCCNTLLQLMVATICCNASMRRFGATGESTFTTTHSTEKAVDPKRFAEETYPLIWRVPSTCVSSCCRISWKK